MNRFKTFIRMRACGSSRYSFVQYSGTSFEGTAKPIQFNANLAIKISFFAFSTCTTQAWTHECMPYTLVLAMDSIKVWSHNNLVDWIKLNSSFIIVANHFGLSSLPASRSSNQTSWLSKYANSWSNFPADLFCFRMCWKDRSRVEYKARSSYDSDSGVGLLKSQPWCFIMG